MAGLDRWYLAALYVSTLGLALLAWFAADVLAAYYGASVSVGAWDYAALAVLATLLWLVQAAYFYSWRNRGFASVEAFQGEKSPWLWLWFAVMAFAVIDPMVFAALSAATIAVFGVRYGRVGAPRIVEPIGIGMAVAGAMLIPLVGPILMMVLAGLEYARAARHLSGAASGAMKGLAIGAPAATALIALPILNIHSLHIAAIGNVLNYTAVSLHGSPILPVAFTLVFAAAALEELVFRSLMERRGDIVNGVFVTLHLPTRALTAAAIYVVTGSLVAALFVGIVVMGVIGWVAHSVLRRAYVLGGLWPAIIAHAAYNAVLTTGDFFTAVTALVLGAALYAYAKK